MLAILPWFSSLLHNRGPVRLLRCSPVFVRTSHAFGILPTENGQNARRVLSTLLQLLRYLVPLAYRPPAGLRSLQQAWSCAVTDGPVTSVARQTACNVCTAGTVAVVVAVAVVVRVAVAVAVTAAVASGQCPPLLLLRLFLLRVLPPAPAPAPCY